MKKKHPLRTRNMTFVHLSFTVVVLLRPRYCAASHELKSQSSRNLYIVQYYHDAAIAMMTTQRFKFVRFGQIS